MGKTHTLSQTAKISRTLMTAGVLIGAGMPLYAQANAGATIVNIASASLSISGEVMQISSNSVSTRIDERLDVALQATGTNASTDASSNAAVPFQLTNSGNGNEAFTLTASTSGMSTTAIAMAIDVNSNGIFDPGIDVEIATGAATPALAPGASLRLLVRLSGVASLSNGRVALRAAAVTGTGSQGAMFAALGDGGSDAIVGSTGAIALAETPLVAGTAEANLLKSQQVVAPDGSATPMSGATITYRLEVVTGAGAGVTAAEITDPVPAGTTYVAGSLQIEGAAISDADDGDAGRFDGTAIRVALGDIAQTTTRVVTFQVKIQ